VESVETYLRRLREKKRLRDAQAMLREDAALRRARRAEEAAARAAGRLPPLPDGAERSSGETDSEEDGGSGSEGDAGAVASALPAVEDAEAAARRQRRAAAEGDAGIPNPLTGASALSPPSRATALRWLFAARAGLVQREVDAARTLARRLADTVASMPPSDDWFFGSENRGRGERMLARASQLEVGSGELDAAFVQQVADLADELAGYARDREGDLAALQAAYDARRAAGEQEAALATANGDGAGAERHRAALLQAQAAFEADRRDLLQRLGERQEAVARLQSEVQTRHLAALREMYGGFRGETIPFVDTMARRIRDRAR
jgi:hypothetical protein